MKDLFHKIDNFFSDDTRKMKRNDFIIVGCLILIYGILSFVNLGSLKNPQTFIELSKDRTASFELKEQSDIYKIRYYSGEEVGSFTLLGSVDGETFDEIAIFSTEYCFQWYDYELNSNFRYFTIVGNDTGYLGEIQLYDSYGNKVEAIAYSDTAGMLVDEANTVPGNISYMNSTYFDEIYFARTAFDYANDMQAIEWVHPPLGKLIQMLPITVMGMTPFSYRLMGNIAGILMIFVMYIFAKEIFKNRKYAFLAAFLMAFDNFHFSQTRMGTVDSFLVLFIMVSSLFMYKYLTLKKTATLKEKRKNLFWCGLFFGLATCVKWTGLYFGLGLAIVFFAKLIFDIINDKKMAKQYGNIILSCILYFVLIPCVIYMLCYFLFPNVYPEKVTSISGLLNQISGMFDYHSTLQADHPFTSKWYTWPIMLRPVWYYVGYPSAGLKSSIVGIGNPAIWWFGVIALIYTLISAVIKKNKVNLFIIVMFLSLWLPYVFIGRVMFLYHYFPALPFVMLAIVSFIKYLTNKFNKKWIPIVYGVIVLILFIWFYPVTSGMTITETYIDSIRWLSTWYF